jgi:hypothetical protein
MFSRDRVGEGSKFDLESAEMGLDGSLFLGREGNRVRNLTNLSTYHSTLLNSLTYHSGMYVLIADERQRVILSSCASPHAAPVELVKGKKPLWPPPPRPTRHDTRYPNFGQCTPVSVSRKVRRRNVIPSAPALVQRGHDAFLYRP